MNKYLLLSLLTGVLESGMIIFPLQYWPSILWLPVFFGLSYQVGTSLANRIAAPKVLIMLIDASLILLAIYLKEPALIAPIIMTLSWRIQQARKKNKVYTSTFKKRMFRVVGFLLSSIFLLPFAAIIFWFLLSLYFLFEDNYQIIKSDNLNTNIWNRWSLTMIIHQSHYFTYVYGVMWVIHVQGDVSLKWIAIIFSSGWLSYLLVEPLVRSKRYQFILVVGHVFLTIVLLLIASGQFPQYTSLLWIATGLGGGTVYCIKRLAPSNISLQFPEEVGHILGAVMALGLVIFTSSWSTAFWMASLLALTTAFLALLLNKGKRVT